MTSIADARPGPGSVEWDPGAYARVTFDSWRDAGWRSVLLRRLESEREVECAELPAFNDQVLVLVTHGRATVESRVNGGRWHRCDCAPGRVRMPWADRLGAHDARVRQAIDFMHDNLALRITLTDIAQAAGLSSFHFVRLFRAAVGQPPRHYLTRVRVESACRLLERGDRSVTDVAYLCGFSSSAHLAAALRRHTGMSPTAYRRDRCSTA